MFRILTKPIKAEVCLLQSLVEAGKEVENPNSETEVEGKTEKTSEPNSKESEETNSSEDESGRLDWKWWSQNYGDLCQDAGIRCDPNEENGECTGTSGCCCKNTTNLLYGCIGATELKNGPADKRPSALNKCVRQISEITTLYRFPQFRK